LKIQMHTEEDLEFSDFSEPTMDIAPASPELSFSALQMFATSLALCTYSVLVGYGETIDTDTTDLRIRIRWAYDESPFRIGEIEMTILWPDVPQSRLEAAERAAGHCTLHNTLERPPRVSTTVQR